MKYCEQNRDGTVISGGVQEAGEVKGANVGPVLVCFGGHAVHNYNL